MGGNVVVDELMKVINKYVNGTYLKVEWENGQLVLEGKNGKCCENPSGVAFEIKEAVRKGGEVYHFCKKIKFNRAQTHRWRSGKYFCWDAIFVGGVKMPITAKKHENK